MRTIVRHINGMVLYEGDVLLPAMVGDRINLSDEEYEVIMKVWHPDDDTMTIIIRKP